MFRRLVDRILRKCKFTQIGIADDVKYNTLLVMKCQTCGVERYVRPNDEIERCS
jgi:hypothetical protein